MFTAIEAGYKRVVAHLTKIIAGIGASVMMIDPAAVANAASNYLSAGAQRKIGVGLFVLVGVRGWYTGRKAKALQAELDELKAKTAA